MKELKTIVKPLGCDYASAKNTLLRTLYWQEFEDLRYVLDEKTEQPEFLLDLKQSDRWKRYEPNLERYFTIHCPTSCNCFLYDGKETHPIEGTSYPEFAKAMSIGFEHEPSFAFGSYWLDSSTERHDDASIKIEHHHFRLLPPSQATEMIMTINWHQENNLCSDRNITKALDTWSKFSYCLPDGNTERYILPLGFHLPCPVDEQERRHHGALIEDRFKEHATQYREYLRQLTTQPLIDELLKDPTTLFQETIELFKKSNKDDNEMAWTRIYMEACIENLAARLRDVGCDKEHMVWFDPTDPFVVQIGAKSQHQRQYKRLLDAIAYVEQFEQNQHMRNQLQAQFERLLQQLKSINGSINFGDFVTVSLPRNKFSADQKPRRVTNYSYSEAGLSSFLTDLKKELEETAAHHTANEELISQLTSIH